LVITGRKVQKHVKSEKLRNLVLHKIRDIRQETKKEELDPNGGGAKLERQREENWEKARGCLLEQIAGRPTGRRNRIRLSGGKDSRAENGRDKVRSPQNPDW